MRMEFKEMMREFIERDFTPSEINEVMDALISVEDNKKMVRINEKQGLEIEAGYYKHYLKDSIEDAEEVLKNFALDYKVEDLV